ncbi:MAG TPA: VanW family protein [Pseudonocardia sp.]|nr:VanW family protein [Pseudonocardia sp.]
MVGLLGVLYGGDLALGAGQMPRGVLVAGVPVGGLSVADAERELRAQIEPRASRPVSVTAGEARSEIDPKTAGLAVDWPGTLDRASSQPLNPFVRISSFFSEREVGVVTATDQEALDSALAALATIVDRPPAEGAVRFEGVNPVAVDPVPGRALDVPAAEAVLQREWAFGRPIALPLTELPPLTDAKDVATAIDDVARPAVSAPVLVTGEQGVQGTLTPEAIAGGVLTFRPDQGGLVPEINIQAATEALDPQLAASETPGRDASLVFSSGQPVITPSKDGRGVDYEATLKDLLSVLTGTGERKITAIYADQPAELTTEELTNLGITGVIGEFTTRGFAPDSGKNIRRAAQILNGMIVGPGETFSLNTATQPRTEANGFVEAGIISDGHASRGVGGGVSQVATTLYNAAYFAGMVDVEHKEHSFYISRYPPGREATVFGDSIDMRFRNDNPTGIMIQTAWTPASITIRLFGTKRYEVTSTPGPRTNPTEPEEVSIPDGEPCVKSNGAPGFTVTDTRTLREISTGQVRRETRTVKYNPSPIVECEDDD